ncbi:hypothetical protein [Endozoicomonas atrinae]|uniref:hypothetical protein n=1 Tax=Endozoicomonas atrinae TaxID=1333660 RepID=UPI003B003C48
MTYSEVVMDSPTIGGSASSLYTQQNQAAGIASASTQESEDSSRQETQLPSRDSYHSEEGPADKAATDRTVNLQPEASVTPKLASVENMTILDSPTYEVATTSESDHEADVSGSESEGKPQALQTSQAEPLPEAKLATSNFVTKPIPADKVTIFIGSNPGKEGTVWFDGQARVKDDINGRYALSAEATGENQSQYMEHMGFSSIDDFVFSRLTCFHLHQNVRHEAINARIDIPIERPKDAEPSAQPYVDIDLKVNQHVAMHLIKIQPEEGGQNLTLHAPEVTLTMTRVSDLPEKSSSKADDKPTGSTKNEPTEASTSSPAELEDITSVVNENAESAAMLPNESEADSKKERRVIVKFGV